MDKIAQVLWSFSSEILSLYLVFQSLAVYSRDRVNPQLFNYALSVALLRKTKILLFFFLSDHISFSIPHCILTSILVILEFMKFFVHLFPFSFSLSFFTFYENIH